MINYATTGLAVPEEPKPDISAEATCNRAAASCLGSAAA
jgi:hypothetical protein